MDLGGFSIGNWGEETYCFNRSVREGGRAGFPRGGGMHNGGERGR